MKLTEAETRVLQVAGLRGDATIQMLAHAAGVRPHVCRRALYSLLDKGILTRRVIVDPAAIGYRICGRWISLKGTTSNVRAQFVKYLMRMEGISYLGEFEGAFDFKVDLYVRTIEDVSRFLELIEDKFGDIFTKRALSSTLGIGDYSLKLSQPNANAACAKVGQPRQLVELSETDKQILSALCLLPQSSNRVLAQKLGLPLATFSYRLNRLKTQGVIAAFHILPDAEGFDAVGLRLNVHRIRLAKIGTASRKAIELFAASDPAVHGFTHSLGDVDLELCTFARSSAESGAFLSRLEDKLGHLLRDRASLVVRRHHKLNGYPFTAGIPR